MSATRALVPWLRRRRPGGPLEILPHSPPVFWGRIGSYEAVTRHGVLLLLAPEAVHPARRVTIGA